MLYLHITSISVLKSLTDTYTAQQIDMAVFLSTAFTNNRLHYFGSVPATSYFKVVRRFKKFKKKCLVRSWVFFFLAAAVNVERELVWKSHTS